MKKVMLAAAVVAFGLSFTSCKRCVECTHPILGSTEFCDGNKTQRDNYKTSMELLGYNCN